MVLEKYGENQLDVNADKLNSVGSNKRKRNLPNHISKTKAYGNRSCDDMSYYCLS